MPHFPTLETGSLAQYPLRVARQVRAVVNETPGGERITAFDNLASEWEWALDYQGLSLTEAAALRALFHECEGRRGEFLFADPCGNLLARSEQFNQAPWQSDPLLSWTSGIADPSGGTAAMRVQNNGGTPQGFRQTIPVPAAYELVFSIWVRSLSATEIVVRRSSGPESMQRAVPLGGEWRRIEITAAALAGTTVGGVLTVEIPGAAAVEFFGAQAEVQRHASGYRRTLDRAGVFLAARFAQDELTFEADGPGTVATRLRISART